MRLFNLLRTRFLTFRKEAVILWFAFRNPATPPKLRMASFFTAAFLLTPLDLIPFSIPVIGPVLGPLMDLVVIPWVVSKLVDRLPQPVRSAAAAKADVAISKWFKRPLLALAVIVGGILVLWIGLLVLLYYWIWG